MAAQGPGLDQKPPCVHIPVRKVPLLLEKSLHNRNRGAAVWSAFRKLRHVVPRAKRCLEDILAAPSSGRVPGWDVGAEVPSLPPAQRADPTPLVAPSWLEPTCCGRVPRSCPALPCPPLYWAPRAAQDHQGAGAAAVCPTGSLGLISAVLGSCQRPLQDRDLSAVPPSRSASGERFLSLNFFFFFKTRVDLQRSFNYPCTAVHTFTFFFFSHSPSSLTF